MNQGEQSRKQNTPTTVRRQITNFSSGIISYGSVSYNILTNPENSSNQSVKWAMNMDFEEILGHAITRKGSKEFGTPPPPEDVRDIWGLTAFYKSNGDIIYVAVFEKEDTGSASIYYLTNGEGDTWAESDLQDREATQHSFAQIGGRLFVVNGKDPMQSTTNGSTWDDTNCIDFDDEVKYLKRFKGRLVALKPNGVFYFSSVVDPFNSPLITWDEDDSMLGNPDDGGIATGMETIGNVLLVFKNNGLYRVDITGRQIDPKLLFNVGAINHHAIATTRERVFFYSGEHIYQTDGNTPPEEVSRPLRDIFDYIQNKEDVDQVYLEAKEQFLYVSCGTIRAYNTVYTNTVLRYSISQDNWTAFNYPFRVKHMVYDSQEFNLLAGGEETIYVIEDGNSIGDPDDKSIPFEMRFHDFDNGRREDNKVLQNDIIVISKHNENTELYIGNEDAFSATVPVESDISIQNMTNKIRGKVIKFELTGISIYKRFIMESIIYYFKNYKL